MTAHTTNIRVYYEDTDAGGIVYHSNYLNFAERARCEFLRDIGHQASEIHNEEHMMFVIKHADIDYIAPSVLDDALTVASSVKKMNNTSFVMQQNVQKNEKDICRITVTLVCVDTNTIKPVRLPDHLRDKFQPYLEDA